MKKYLFSLLMLLCTQAGWASKANPQPVTITQADGTQLTVTLMGDEHFSWAKTTDGVLLVREGFNYYVAKVNADGTLSATTILAHQQGRRSQDELMAVGEQARDSRLFYDNLEENAVRASQPRREPVKELSTYFPHVGSPRALVILAEFQDSTFLFGAHSKVIFDQLFNADVLDDTLAQGKLARSYGSVKKYYESMSFGQYTPQYDVVGPVRLPNPLVYYGKGQSDNNTALLRDACLAVDDSVDFAQYDANDDGNIDLVYVVYASYGANTAGNSSDCIWPRSGTITLSNTFDGKKVRRFGVTNELIAHPTAWKTAPYQRITGIGEVCHEFAHCLGLPDMYATAAAAQTKNYTPERWDLMDSGEYLDNGYTPPPLSAWEREALGWLTIDTLSQPDNVTLTSIDEGGKAYRILNDNDQTGHEYYIVQNVQQRGWGSKLYGKGMLVYHIDYNASKFSLESNAVNNEVHHERYKIVPADGISYIMYNIGDSLDVNGNILTLATFNANFAGDTFPGETGNTELTDSSAVKAVVYTGEYLGKPITDIQESDEGIVTFKFMGGKTIVDAIRELEGHNDAANKKVYGIDGRYVGQTLDGLPRGVYVVDGKKRVVR